MIVTAWNNGAHHTTGAGYGFKLQPKDRDSYFKRKWRIIYLELKGIGVVEVNVKKQSFWKTTCPELINKKIGIWLFKNGKPPWPKGHPTKMKMVHMSGNRFKVI